MRLVVAGSTGADAERLANKASDGVRAHLWRHYGITATPVGRAYSAPSSAYQRPFRLRFSSATPRLFPTAGRVLFQQPAVSIDPGNGWMRCYIVGFEPECELALLGKGKFAGGFIGAYKLLPGCTNLQSGARELRPRTNRELGLVESSVKEEPFATQSGLHGVEISFTQQYPCPSRGGMNILTQTTHNYLFTNAQSCLVYLSYHTASADNDKPGNNFSGSDSENVQRMIQRTLRVE